MRTCEKNSLGDIYKVQTGLKLKEDRIACEADEEVLEERALLFESHR